MNLETFEVRNTTRKTAKRTALVLLDKPGQTLDKMAFSFTGDLGCEFGGGVSCHGNTAGGPKQSFIGFMLYDRTWFKKDTHGLTIGGGMINNPGRYLVLLPPINGETAPSAAINAPYFTGNPGDPFKAWDMSVTYDYAHDRLSVTCPITIP